MELGAFSVSLNVKDLKASKEFYQKLGFSVFHGEEKDNWLIMKNGNTAIGLFQGMFDKNILTFNPGWDQAAQTLTDFDDVRTIQKSLEEAGLVFEQKADPNGSGPGSFVIVDPDGNPILVDQHI